MNEKWFKSYTNEIFDINTYYHMEFYGDFIFRFTNCISHICCSWKKYCAQILATTKYVHVACIKTWTIKVELSRAMRLVLGSWVAHFFGPNSSRTTATRVKHRAELISERCKHAHKSHILLCEIPILCPNPRLYCHLTHLSKPKRTVS